MTVSRVGATGDNLTKMRTEARAPSHQGLELLAVTSYRRPYGKATGPHHEVH
jgi:hypothetical protein